LKLPHSKVTPVTPGGEVEAKYPYLSSTRKDGNEKLTIGPQVQNESEDEGRETKALPNPPDPGRQQGGVPTPTPTPEL